MLPTWLELPSDLGPAELGDLQRRADLAMAQRSLPGTFSYPAGCLLLGLASPFAGDAPALVFGIAGATFLLAVARTLFLKSSAELHARDSDRWRLLHRLLLFTSVGLWSLLANLAIVRYGVGWTCLMALLIGAAICSVAIIIYAQDLFEVKLFLASILLPGAATLGVTGSREGRWLIVAFALFGFYVWVQATRLHREYWHGLVSTKLVEVRARELEVARRDAEAASRAKTDFLANMSHEIRTPINAIIGLSEQLLKAPLADHDRQSAELIDSSAEILIELVDGILDFSKIEAGKVEIERVGFSPRELVARAVDLVAARAATKGIELAARVDDAVPAGLTGDPVRLRQVLVNLLGNAVKFTAEGRVAVEATVDEDRGGGLRIRFAVSDTGIGIAAEARPRLFEAFTQADSSTTRRFGGTGLGLAISKRLVEVMGGEIGVDSAPDRGSVFWFAVPVERAAAVVAASPAVEPGPGPLARARLLLVEDNPVNRLVTLRQLAALGLQADAAENGVAALALVERQVYDLILMDCQMPELDGYETTRRIRRREGERQRRTVIVAMTAHAIRGDREKCLAAGMDDYLSKPFRERDLELVLRRWLP